MITLKVKALVLSFVQDQSATIEYTVDTVDNATGTVIETLGPWQCAGSGTTNAVGDLNIDLSGIVTEAINRIAAVVAAGSN